MSDKVSEEFDDAFSDRSGGNRGTCACGREHFDTYNQWGWEDGELEHLIQLSKEKPDKYIGHEGAIGGHVVDGVSFIWGCPCQGALKYEKFIIRHAEQIAYYLNKRAERLRHEADNTKVGV